MEQKKQKIGSKYFRVLTIWYDKKGRITNPKEVERVAQGYYIEESIASGHEEGKWWADFFCVARQ